MKFDSNGWLDAAQEVNYSANSMPRQGYGIKYLVIHGTAGGTSAQGIGQYFQSTIGGSNPVSSHLIIDQQGNIVQGVPLSLAAFANGVITNGHAAYLLGPSINPNWYTASIEFVKASTDNSDALTAIQQQVGFEVIQCICDTYSIHKRAGDANGGIIKHADIDPINRALCPNTFDFNALWAYLANGGDTNMIPVGWADDGHTLTAPNKIPVVRGFRDYILANAWDPNDYPEALEYSANPVEESNVPIGPGTAQDFRMSRLGYTAKMSVYKTWLGQEYVWYKKQVATLQAQIVQLQSLPAVANLLAINTLAAQIVQKSQVQ